MSDDSSQTASAQLPLKRQRGQSLNIGAFERGKKISSRRTFKDTLKLWEIKYCSDPRDEEVRILPSLIHVIREANLISKIKHIKESLMLKLQSDQAMMAQLRMYDAKAKIWSRTRHRLNAKFDKDLLRIYQSLRELHRMHYRNLLYEIYYMK